MLPGTYIGSGMAAGGALATIAVYEGDSEDIITLEWDGLNWAQVGNMSATGIGHSANTHMKTLSASRVAIMSSFDELETWDWDGLNWSQVGNTATLTNSTGGIGSMTSSRIAFCDFDGAKLETWDFDGTDWSQTGSGLTITSPSSCEIEGLSSTRVAFWDGFNDSIRTYDWGGSSWSQTGSAFSLGGNYASMTALSSTRIAWHGSPSGNLSTYDFNGSTWSLVGNSLDLDQSPYFLTSGSDDQLAALDEKTVAYVNTSGKTLHVFEFDGTDWSEIGNSYDLDASGTDWAICVFSFSVAPPLP